MMENDDICFIHPQKTAGTTVYKILNACLVTPIRGSYHGVPSMISMQEKHVLLTIRNPVEWYVSMWSHLRRGMKRPMAIRAFRMCPDKDKKRLYGENTPECFKEWFREAIMHIEHSCGLYTHRLAHMTRCRFDLIDSIVRKENLAHDLHAFLSTQKTKPNWEQLLDSMVTKKWQATDHGKYSDYYTPDMIRMIKQQDFLIYDNWYSGESIVSHGMHGCPFLEKFDGDKFKKGVYNF